MPVHDIPPFVWSIPAEINTLIIKVGTFPHKVVHPFLLLLDNFLKNLKATSLGEIMSRKLCGFSNICGISWQI